MCYIRSRLGMIFANHRVRIKIKSLHDALEHIMEMKYKIALPYTFIIFRIFSLNLKYYFLPLLTTKSSKYRSIWRRKVFL